MDKPIKIEPKGEKVDKNTQYCVGLTVLEKMDESYLKEEPQTEPLEVRVSFLKHGTKTLPKLTSESLKKWINQS